MGVHVFTDLEWVYGAIITWDLGCAGGSRIAHQISDEQGRVTMEVEVEVGAHGVFSLSLGTSETLPPVTSKLTRAQVYVTYIDQEFTYTR